VLYFNQLELRNEEMNKLSIDRQCQIIKIHCEGNSLRSTARITGTSVNTVTNLIKQVGAACLDYQDRVMRNLTCKKLQVDEIWPFVYSKDKNVPEDKQGQFGYGDVWTFTAIDAETKIIPSWVVGLRDARFALNFANDLKSRLSNRVQITTDGHKMYLEAVESAFGSDVDYAQLVKLYGQTIEGEKRYSPAECISTEKHVIQGNPDIKAVSTSYVERQNLTMRMSLRRFTRLTNGFSKKLENHVLALSVYFMYYNFARPHKTLANPYPRSPAMAAGISDHIWSIEEIVKLLISN
jgi:IS1 family transposase